MGKPHPIELRERAVALVERGNTHTEIARRLCVSIGERAGRPHAGAWIETMPSPSVQRIRDVAPVAPAWPVPYRIPTRPIHRRADRHGS